MFFIACTMVAHITVCAPRYRNPSKFEEVSHKAAQILAANRNEYGAHLLNRKAERSVRLSGTALASWYGPGFHGRQMANGKRFNMNDPQTVAHKKLPLGTRVELRNPENGRSLVATVRDRGPYVYGREFDVSKSAAERLGFRKDGLALVEFRVLSLPNSGAS